MEKHYRYPGIKPFDETERHLFFGRKKDIELLSKRIQLEPIIILYGKSGLGKSSLLAAGLIPFLNEQEEKSVSIYLRFGNFFQAPNETISKDELVQIFFKKIQNTAFNASFFDEHIEQVAEGNQIWEFFKKLQKQGFQTFHLIIDQAEEIFTYPKECYLEVADLFAEMLAPVHPKGIAKNIKKLLTDNLISDEEFDFLNKNIEIKFLFAVRSDKLSQLNKFKDAIPSILNVCYELKALSRLQAEDAIFGPAYVKSDDLISQNFDFSEQTIDEVLNFLSKKNTKPIESFQLQIICRYAEKIAIEQNLNLIQWHHLGDIEEILQNYYDVEIEKLGNENDIRLARKLIEEGLILEEEMRRVSLHDGVIKHKFKVSQTLLKKLEDSRLLRGEPNIDGGVIYELSHDTLVEPILRSRRKRLDEETAKLAEASEREREKIHHQMSMQNLKKQFRYVLLVLLGIGMTVAYFSYSAYLTKEGKYEKLEVQVREELKINKKDTIWEEKFNYLNKKLTEYKNIVDYYAQDSLRKLYSRSHSADDVENQIAEMRASRSLYYDEFNQVKAKINAFRDEIISINVLIKANLSPQKTIYQNDAYYTDLQKGIMRDFDNFQHSIKYEDHVLGHYWANDFQTIEKYSIESSLIQEKNIKNQQKLSDYKHTALVLAKKLEYEVYQTELQDEKEFVVLKRDLIDVVKERINLATK